MNSCRPLGPHWFVGGRNSDLTVGVAPNEAARAMNRRRVILFMGSFHNTVGLVRPAIVFARHLLSLKGCQIVAGGRSAAQTTGCEEMIQDTGSVPENSGTLSGCGMLVPIRWSTLRSDHRLLSGSPSGCDLKPPWLVFEIANCDLKASASGFVSRNIKSLGNRLRLR